MLNKQSFQRLIREKIEKIQIEKKIRQSLCFQFSVTDVIQKAAEAFVVKIFENQKHEKENKQRLMKK